MMLANELIAGIRETPMTAAIGCAAIAPTIVWSIGMINWMIMGEIDAVYGLPSIMLGILLCYVALDPPEPVHATLAFGGIVGMLIVFPIARRQLIRRELIQIDIDQIARAYQMLAEKPDNAVTRFKLAESIYVRGMVGHAIEIGDEALSGMPQDMFPNEIRTVEKWKRQARDPNLFRPIPCLECNFYNKPSKIYCERCGSEYLAIYAKGRWLGAALIRKLIASWIIAMVALVGLPITLALETMPVSVTVSAIVLQFLLIGLLTWRAFLHKEDAVV